MATCPFAVQRPVSAHGGPIGAIVGVVEHVTAGEGDPYNEFANPANQVSSHFGIGNGQGGMADGALEQYVDTALQSWAQVAGNIDYVSVETEGEPTDPLTPAQVATFGRLMAWVHAVHGVPLVVTDAPGHAGLITHGDGGAAWGGHTGCPGALRSAQRPAILAAAGPPAPPPAPPPPVNPIGPTYPVGAYMQTPVTIPTDDNGDGWVQTAIPWPIVALFHEGSDPGTDKGYWPGEAHAQDRNNCALVSVTRCTPLSNQIVYVTH